ncbi:IS110 family transposase, partial [Desulfocurvus sp. DL9XJH121]
LVATHAVSMVVLEATGGYERGLLNVLCAEGVPASVANPRQVRDFAKSLGILAKTDTLDARVLRRFGETTPQRPYRKPSKEMQRLRALIQERMHLVRLMAAQRCRLATL